MNGMTIGQYYPVNSRIHRLDPRVKLVAAFIYITMLFLVKNFWGYLFAAFFVSLTIYASKVPIIYMLRGLKNIIFIITFMLVMNIFFTKGERVLFSIWKISVTMEGLILSARMAVRLILLVVGTSILTLTTSPIQLTDGIEYLLKPFKRFGVPAHEIAMMMSIALRFIPTLVEELDKIMKAQKARGADFDTGGLMKKAKSLIPLLVPLFISAFRRADELAMAMEARCYRGDYNRTRMKEMKLYPYDYRFMAVVGAFCIAVIGSRFV